MFPSKSQCMNSKSHGKSVFSIEVRFKLDGKSQLSSKTARKAFANAMVARSGTEEYDNGRSPRWHAIAPTIASRACNGAVLVSPFRVFSPNTHLDSSTMTGEPRYELTKVGILNRKDDLGMVESCIQPPSQWRTYKRRLYRGRR